MFYFDIDILFDFWIITILYTLLWFWILIQNLKFRAEISLDIVVIDKFC
jgi:hypothetical protein